MKKDKVLNRFRISKYLKQHIFGITLIILGYVILSGVTVATTIVGAKFIAILTEKNFDLAFKYLFWTLILVVINEIACIIINYTSQRTKILITNTMSIDIAEQVFKISSKSYSDHNTANFTRRISSDPTTFFSYIQMFLDGTYELITTAIVTIYICTLNIYVGLFIILCLIIGVTIETFRRRIYAKNKKIMLTKGEKVGSLLNEVVRSEKDIKCLNLEKPLKNQITLNYEDYQAQHLKTNYIDVTFMRTRALFLGVMNVLLLFLGAVLMEKAIITFATFMIVYSNRSDIRRLIFVLGNFSSFYTEMKLSYERIYELFENKEYALEKFGKKKLKNVVGTIEFKNVKYTYIDHGVDENYYKLSKKEKKTAQKYIETGRTEVFKNLSFKIENNTTVAFVGKSGSGKSTILNLISKMYDCDKGKVLIDGTDIKTLNKDTIRSSIALVNQFPYIFDMSIKENLRMARQNASDEEIIQALKDAALYDFIETLPKGIDSRVGESGVKLSGGQKQRLAIARALLKKPSILLFDESTSSLDNIAQAKVKESIDNIKGKSTVVIVAHRLSTIKNADKIFFLDEGEIVDQGTFDELYKNNKTFKTMFLAENI